MPRGNYTSKATRSRWPIKRLRLEQLESRRMLTIDISGNGNTDAASLLAAGGPGDPTQGGFVNVGLSPTHGAGVTYLGNGWIITANHVSVGATSNTVVLGGNTYTIDDPTTGVALHNPDNSTADLKLYHLSTTPNLPSLVALIDSAAPSGRVIMVGNGLNIGTQHYWHVDTSLPTWQWTEQSPPANPGPNDVSGFDITGGHIIRWGENEVASTGLLINDGYGITTTFTTQFDDLKYTGVAPLASEAQATNGDSGGAVFALVGGQWQLSGIMLATNNPDNNQPANTALLGDVTYIADLSAYRSEILATINTAPTVDLNGGAAGTGFTSQWTGVAVAIADAANATVTDDGTTLVSMTVQLVSPSTGDVLAANTSGTSITQSYSNGTLSLTGSDTVADYQQVLRTITYNNTSGGPGVAQETATVVANDGVVNSTPVTATINMPAPTLSLTAGAGSGAPNYTTTWYNQGSIPIENNVLATIGSPSGMSTLNSLTVTLATFHTGDVLSLAPLGGVSLALTSSYSAGTLTLSGTDTVAHYQQALRFINYNNTVGGPGATPITATFVANDGTHSSNPVTSTVNINVGSGQVLGNRLFYNNSKYDLNNGAIDANDDLAIASDKTGYTGTGTATFANISAFNKGITGIMVDLQSGIGTHSAINLTSGDVTFKVSPASFVTTTYNQLSTWSAAPSPSAISVRMGAGQGGSDRLEITFGTGVITNQWIEVDVHAGGNTGLSADDVFYFGSVIGDSGAADTALLAKTDGNDYTVPFNNIVGLTTPVWNLADYTKDGKVDGNDATTAISNVFTLHYLANPTGPFAPNGGGSAAPAAAPSAAPANVMLPTISPSATGAISSALSVLHGSTSNSSAIRYTLQHAGIITQAPRLLQFSMHDPQVLQAVDQITSNLNIREDVLERLLAELESV
jgi:hypothetical protein